MGKQTRGDRGSQWLVVSAIALVELAGTPQRGMAQWSEAALKEQYRAAIRDAAVVEPGENVDRLLPITPDNSTLVWSADKTKLLVVTWKSQTSFDRFIQPFSNSSTDESRLLWVTVAPEIQSFCEKYLKANPTATEADLVLRLKQHLGLDPDWQYNVFVELWVRPQDLFRPCADPETSDRQCNLEFGKDVPQVSGITPQARIKNYRQFYQGLYYQSIRRFLQPFTGLGYTYDWGNPANRVGASEFILIPGAAYTVQQAVPTLKYCQRSSPQ